MKTLNTDTNINKAWHQRSMPRLNFMKVVGLSGAGAIALSACDDDNDDSNGINLGSGDTGILNYAFALEQLESAFYQQVTSNTAFTSIFSIAEQNMLAEIRDNEIVHREFYRTALGSNAIQDLDPDFSSVDFTNRVSVLNTAHTFEDTGIAAYNGSAQFLSDVNILAVAGKIVSIEARHSAMLRNMLAPKTAAFAGDDAINPLGLDLALVPFEVLAMVQPYLKNKLNGNNLSRV